MPYVVNGMRVLVAIGADGILRGQELVACAAQYRDAMTRLAAVLDEQDPLPPLRLLLATDGG